MRGRRFPAANQVYALAGGNEDNDLWVEIEKVNDRVMGEQMAVRSVWVPTDDERAALAAGSNISIRIIGGQPPMSVFVTDEQPGKAT